MRLLFSFLFFAFTSGLQAQQPDSTAIVYMPNTFYTDYYGPFLTWGQRPVAFTLDVYDRWGNLLFSEDKNPDFNFADSKEKTFHENETYIIVLKYALPDGKSHQMSGHATYLGFYCSG